MLGCALLKVRLREPLTCLELETAWALAKRPREHIGYPRPAMEYVFRCFSEPMSLLKYLPAGRRMPLVTRSMRDPDVNPCLSESDASARCLDENNYDKERCSTYFMKYKNCRKFWNSVMIQRRQSGVKPPMPTAAERDEILGALGRMPY